MRTFIIPFVLMTCLAGPPAHAQAKRDWGIEAARGIDSIAHQYVAELSQVLRDLLPDTRIAVTSPPDFDIGPSLRRLLTGASNIAIVKLDSLTEIREDFAIFANPFLTVRYSDMTSMQSILNPLADRLLTREGLKL